MESLVGRKLGKYELTAMIGGGGMATVYEAQHPGLGQRVAVKILHPFLSTDPTFVDRFRREAHAVAALRHPNIVRVLDFDHEEHLYYMVMEYIGGPTLSTVLSKRRATGGLSLAEIRRIFTPLCSAVDYAASRGMVHRDIKPANIIMSDDGEPILTDYGIAKMVGSTSITSPGTVVGSAHYMSPEQAQGQDADVRSDLYSLGIVLFECLSGAVPFDGDTTVTVLIKHISAPVPSIRALRPNLPPAVEPMLARALAKLPQDRYEMGAIFAEELAVALTPSKSDLAVTEVVAAAAVSTGLPPTTVVPPVKPAAEQVPAAESVLPVTPVPPVTPTVEPAVALAPVVVAASVAAAGATTTAAQVSTALDSTSAEQPAIDAAALDLAPMVGAEPVVEAASTVEAPPAVEGPPIGVAVAGATAAAAVTAATVSGSLPPTMAPTEPAAPRTPAEPPIPPSALTSVEQPPVGATRFEALPEVEPASALAGAATQWETPPAPAVPPPYQPPPPPSAPTQAEPIPSPAGATPIYQPGPYAPETQAAPYAAAPSPADARAGAPPRRSNRKRVIIIAVLAVVLVAAIGAAAALALQGGGDESTTTTVATTSTTFLSTTTTAPTTSTTMMSTTTSKATTTTVKATTTSKATTTTKNVTTTTRRQTTTTRRPTTTSPPDTIGPGTTTPPDTIGPG